MKRDLGGSLGLGRKTSLAAGLVRFVAHSILKTRSAGENFKKNKGPANREEGKMT